jgi:hypothetical protein
MSQNNTVHKIYLNIIFSSIPRNSKTLKISSPKFQYAFPLLHACKMPQPVSSVLAILRAHLVQQYKRYNTKYVTVYLVAK